MKVCIHCMNEVEEQDDGQLWCDQDKRITATETIEQ